MENEKLNTEDTDNSDLGAVMGSIKTEWKAF